MTAVGPTRKWLSVPTTSAFWGTQDSLCSWTHCGHWSDLTRSTDLATRPKYHVSCDGCGWWIVHEVPSIETTRDHHAVRQRGHRVAACGMGTAATANSTHWRSYGP